MSDATIDPAPGARAEPACRPLGGQPPFESESLDRFFAGRHVAVLGYLRSDGRPHQAPIWYTHHAGRFHLTTLTGSPKHRALRRDPRISLTVQDERPPYRAVIVSGRAELRPLDPGDDPTEGMAIRYFGRAAAGAYERMMRSTWDAQGLTLVTLAPEEVMGFDNTRAMTASQRAFLRLREWLPLPRAWL